MFSAIEYSLYFKNTIKSKEKNTQEKNTHKYVSNLTNHNKKNHSL